MYCCGKTSIPSSLELLTASWLAGYRCYTAAATETAWREYASRRIRKILESPNTETLVWGEAEAPGGVAAWSYLPWDSGQFGFPAARIEFLTGEGTGSLLQACLEQARERGIRHLIARPAAGDLTGIAVLTRAGFELIDGIQTFAREARGEPQPHIRPFERSDLEAVLHIARTAYSYDRFHNDRALPWPVADRINETWVLNSCLGQTADAVLVAAEAGGIQGFVTCQIDRDSGSILGVPFGTIGMVATSPEARRRGVARALTEAALAWFHRHSAGIVEVGTQLANVPAARLYESCGFRQVRTCLTLRLVLE